MPKSWNHAILKGAKYWRLPIWFFKSVYISKKLLDVLRINSEKCSVVV